MAQPVTQTSLRVRLSDRGPVSPKADRNCEVKNIIKATWPSLRPQNAPRLAQLGDIALSFASACNMDPLALYVAFSLSAFRFQFVCYLLKEHCRTQSCHQHCQVSCSLLCVYKDLSLSCVWVFSMGSLPVVLSAPPSTVACSEAGRSVRICWLVTRIYSLGKANTSASKHKSSTEDFFSPESLGRLPFPWGA